LSSHESSHFCLRFQDCEVERIRKEEEAKYKKELTDRESQFQAGAFRREEEITRKLKDAEDRLARQRQDLDDDLQVKEKQLSELATRLQEQRSEIALKLEQVEVSYKLLLRKQGLLDENIASRMAQVVTLLICVQEVSGLNLGSNADYPV
jgi:hypothetical protein